MCNLSPLITKVITFLNFQKNFHLFTLDRAGSSLLLTFDDAFAKQGHSLDATHGLPIAVASLVAEHGL